MNIENVNTDSNNKQKKSLPIKAIIGVIVIIFIVVGFIYLILNKQTDSKIAHSGSRLSAKEISGVKEYKGNIPEFSITISGAHIGEVTNENLSKMSVLVYKFDAGIDNGWETVTNEYVGIKVKELLDASDITNFTEVTFEATNKASITYFKNEITDNMYIVFMKDGKAISDKKTAMLLATDYDYNYSLKELTNIYVPSNYDNVNDNMENPQ